MTSNLIEWALLAPIPWLQLIWLFAAPILAVVGVNVGCDHPRWRKLLNTLSVLLMVMVILHTFLLGMGMATERCVILMQGIY